jgi:hypothetical protein
MLSNPIGTTVREYSMKPHLALDIIQSLKPFVELDLAAWNIFRIFV